jgi:hypothetical protein
VTGPAARVAGLSDDQLAAVLVDLGRSIQYPSAPPDLADRVVTRLAAEATAPARAGRFRRWSLDWLMTPTGDERRAGRPRLRPAAVLALIALLVLAGLAAAVAFGIPGIRLVFVGPTAMPGASASPAGSPVGSLPASPSLPALEPALAPGHQVTLEEARAAADFPVEVPGDPAIGQPDAVYLDGTGAEARVTLVYGARPGMPLAAGASASALLTQFRGAVNADLFVKIVEPGTTVDRLNVGGRTGYWIAGRPHVIFYRVGSDSSPEEIRLAGNVLIWEHDGITFRLETTADQATATSIATSMR